jgi:hypothetical protein
MKQSGHRGARCICFARRLCTRLSFWSDAAQNRDKIAIPVYPTKLAPAGQLNRNNIKAHLRVNLPRAQLGNAQPVVRAPTSTAHYFGALQVVKPVLKAVIEPRLKSVQNCHTRIYAEQVIDYAGLDITPKPGYTRTL